MDKNSYLKKSSKLLQAKEINRIGFSERQEALKLFNIFEK